ncbi:regulatory protein [Novosphingobium chloroacetimidivorans]|uniref:Regulatory protein RecX n=1 Tax=Novosphingobium chloroacetimidivorans TaxID=1428314 RepID=A0A7W7NYH7_9SPHN|nr:RecX family transcriptional regulator [Novosphingobium chloroacetimidivorans]MBB4860212.1 regulatory protein [Novosphingobium chloroacetimidivorans]
MSDTKLEELALAYVARFATTRAKLEGYLQRKLRERGWDGEQMPDAAALSRRFAQAGYVDDAVYARMKADSLLRRGYGGRRVGEALRAAGVEEALRADVAPELAEARLAAAALARRRRFGPWHDPLPDRLLREKQIAAMLRAGHTLDMARQIVEATAPAAIEDWIESARGDGHCE